MLRRLSLRDFVIVPALELDFGPGYTALTGETGAGKSILIDALQLALGQRADGSVVREGAARAEIAAEFDTPEGLAGWLSDGGFDSAADPDGHGGGSLLLRRTVDSQGKSRAWINGAQATLSQLRELGDWLVDIHGQHAWQGLTRPEPVRALLDSRAGVDAAPLAAAHQAWKQARERLDAARSRQAERETERERLIWQIGEVERLGPGEGEWAELEAEHRRLSHAQAILDALAAAVAALDGGESGEAPGASACIDAAIDRLEAVWVHDNSLSGPIDTLRQVQALISDSSRELGHRLHGEGLDPQRLSELDERLGSWLALARRFRQPPEALPTLLAQWQAERARLDAESDLPALEAAVDQAWAAYRQQAEAARRARLKAAPRLAAEVGAALQQLGMAGSVFEVAVDPLPEPQRHGQDLIEFRVAGHAGATPRALARVASGGELSRIALAIAVSTCSSPRPGTDPLPGVDTLIFDEIDAGVGGTVADAVGALMHRLGRERQVFAVTHLPQVAACANQHFVVRKQTVAGRTHSEVEPVDGEARVEELARMLGGESATSRAHARSLLAAETGRRPPAPVTPINTAR
ncbi:DNA repair protein RecN [Piscinibacter sp. Jin2]|uniref:DNA repair protein RecN n=1 Tax=Aquariibacter lacus TaxID=2801332 RepID=A0A9X0XG55_9BURK|nr:DNA repair protein RecN [Piscinibacter lacus]MBL0718910.1 DNA repair protein RecN [Piscinibacter lacus]